MYASADGLDATRQASANSAQSSTTSWDGTIQSVASTSTSISNDAADAGGSSRKTSAALREQIAKAKKAKREAIRRGGANQARSPPAIISQEEPIVPADPCFDFGVGFDDPFNLKHGQDPKKRVLSQRIQAARTSGKLNIAALNLKDIPDEITKMYEPGGMDSNDGSWAESVDLTRLVAADNEFELLSDAMFPDVGPENFDDEDDSQMSIFAGLNSMDLHNNFLINVPVGWRRLSYVTSLNLVSRVYVLGSVK